MIDDEPELLASLERPLKTRYHVIAMNRSTQVMETLKSTHVDMILLDIRMPGITGLELLKEIKFTYPHIPILIMTGHGDNEDTIISLKYGAAGYIRKPIDIYLLFSEISRIINNKNVGIKSPAQILLVDNDIEFSQKTQAALQEHGYDIHTACSTETALKVLEKETFDIIIMDIENPDMHCFDFLEKIKKIQDNFIPIVVTRFNSQELAIEAIKVSAQASTPLH